MLINILRRESWVQPLILFQTSAFHCSFSAEASHQHREVSDPNVVGWWGTNPFPIWNLSSARSSLHSHAPKETHHQMIIKTIWEKTHFQISPCMIASLLMLLPGPPLLGQRGNIVVKNTHRVLIFSLCHTCYSPALQNWTSNIADPPLGLAAEPLLLWT